jgi:hypothetical protein
MYSAIFGHAPDEVRTDVRNSPVPLVPIPLDLPGIRPRMLFLLTAGNINDEYYSRVRNLDAHSAYSRNNADVVVESFRNQLKETYEFILIDSRTGNTEIGGLNVV